MKSAKPTAYSFSRLTTYDKCGELYRLLYEARMHELRQDTIYTRLGSFVHAALEAFYGDETDTVASPYEALAGTGGIWDKELEATGLTMLRDDLLRYASHMTKLYARASANYRGKDAIRKADGTITAYPHLTGPGRDYIKQWGLNNLSAKIDRLAAQSAPEKWGGLSLCDVYAQTVGILYPYTNPVEIDSVLAIELPISEIKYQAADSEGNKLMDGDEPITTSRTRGPHPVYSDADGNPVIIGIENEFFLPTLNPDGSICKDEDGTPVWSQTALFHGYIDMLVRDAQGRLIIVDHKTSKELPSPAKVARHEQLLAYGYAIYFLTGEMPYAIAINHLRSNKFVLAPFELAKAEKALSRLISVQNGIEAKVFVKKDPDAYQTPCVRQGQRGDSEYELCAGLKFCHPDVYEYYQALMRPDIF